MLVFTIAMLVMLILLDKALRRGRLESLRIETRFKLFSLRDELRTLVINGSVPHNKWFDYLDTTITKTIDSLPKVNVWEVLAMWFVHRNDQSIALAEAKLFAALREEQNRQLATIYEKFVLCITAFLIERHHVSVMVAVRGAQLVGKMLNLRDRLAKTVTVSPETSTLLKYS